MHKSTKMSSIIVAGLVIVLMLAFAVTMTTESALAQDGVLSAGQGEAVPLPEPVTLVLFGTGLAALTAATAARHRLE